MRLPLRGKVFNVLSHAQKRRFNARPAPIARCTLAVTGRQPSKASVIKELSHGLRVSGVSSAHRTGGAVLMVTPEFARWLEDQDFISRILGGLDGTTNEFSSIQLLSGVVDALGDFPGPRGGKVAPVKEPLVQRGFSILSTSWADVLLPGLWRETEAATAESIDDPERASAVTFAMTSEGRDGNARPASDCWEVTLPLANTVFQNGRRTTLFASQWNGRGDSGESTDLVKMVEKRHQLVQAFGRTSFKLHIPLLPLTPPRKIVAGLGNIVRQVEVDGTANPASRELEILIPKLFEKRSKEDRTIERGPVGIWTWVIPPQVVESGLLEEINQTFAGQPQISEPELASKAAPVFDKLIEHGCRLHRILSGGGGWGTKQGLLSLDPETTYPLVENEDAEVERFIKAFQHRGDEVQPEGLVTPGSYLLFCTEPMQAKGERGQPRPDISSIGETGLVLGVAPETEQSHPDSLGGEGTVKLYEKRFGASSSAGLYLKKGSFTTKIDVPRTVLVQGPEHSAGFTSSQ